MKIIILRVDYRFIRLDKIIFEVHTMMQKVINLLDAAYQKVKHAIEATV